MSISIVLNAYLWVCYGAAKQSLIDALRERIGGDGNKAELS